jgi:hypothetical protein
MPKTRYRSYYEHLPEAGVLALAAVWSDVDFFSGPKPIGTFHEPSEALRADKKRFGSSRAARWFGRAGA